MSLSRRGHLHNHDGSDIKRYALVLGDQPFSPTGVWRHFVTRMSEVEEARLGEAGWRWGRYYSNFRRLASLADMPRSPEIMGKVTRNGHLGRLVGFRGMCGPDGCS